ncbi:MAG: response regulator transcription factor [Actinomycetota bacterium]
MTRVVVVDDQPMMRAAFRTILEAAGHDVVGEAGDGDDALAVVDEHEPEVVLMDVRMPGRDGLSATAAILRRHSGVRVIVLTTFDLDEYVTGALDAGASGFLLKNARPEELVTAVERVADGDAVLDPTVTRRLIDHLGVAAGAVAHADHPEIERLTEREKDVLALICEGCTNAEIAERLGVGAATSKTHVSRVITKLGVRDRVQAVIKAYEVGFAPVRRPSS